MEDKREPEDKKDNQGDEEEQEKPNNNNEKSKDEEETKGKIGKSGEASKNNKEISDHLMEMEKNLKAKTEEAKDYKERMLRIAAEFDNYKKRVQVDLSNANSLGKQEVIKKLLPVIDEFELALKAVEKSDNKEVKEGIEMVYKNIMDTLRKEGLQEIASTGKYDPYMHDIAAIKDSDEPDGNILQVITKGYKFNNNIIRPASVIISKKENISKEDKKEDEKSEDGKNSEDNTKQN